MAWRRKGRGNLPDVKLLKFLAFAFVLLLVGGVVAAVTASLRSKPKNGRGPLSYEHWPTVPAKPKAA